MHGNPTLLLPGGAVAGQVVIVSDAAGQAVWRSHPLAAGHAAVCVDVRDGRFGGPGRGWSVLPPGRYQAPGIADVLEVVAQRSIAARFAGPPADWLPPGTAWHQDGVWGACGGEHAGIVPATGSGERNRGRADRAAAEQGGGCAYLFVDAAMHGAIEARFTAPSRPSRAAWGLIARHYNDAHHLRLELRRETDCVVVRLQRRAADADPAYRPLTLDRARVAPADGARSLRWQFNGTRHEVALDGEPLLAAHDGFMGGVEVVGLFAEAGATTAVWHAFSAVSSQWVPRHLVRRGCYAAVLRPGNIHQLHLSADPGHPPARPDPRTNVFWESGLQVGHIGGSEIKFTQGAALDLLSRGAVADLVRWRGPMPRFVEQDADVRGYARGHAVCYDAHLVVADWAAVRVRRSVGPDFDLLARAMSGAARFAAADTCTFAAWKLPADGLMGMLLTGACGRLFPAALVFPLRVAGAAWHLVAALGGLSHVGGEVPGRVFGWRCPRGLTASYDLRVAPTEPGVEYGFWIALSWLATADTRAAEAAALHLREQFRTPAAVTARCGAADAADAVREQPADAHALTGCFDRGLGAYRLQAEAGRVRFAFDPGAISRHRPVFLVTSLGSLADDDAGAAVEAVRGGARATATSAPGAGVQVTCAVDDVPLTAGRDFRWQPWPSPEGVLVQLRRTVAAPLTVEIGSGAPAH